MRIFCAICLAFLLQASTFSQDSSDIYIGSLEMPCYPPLARQAHVEGETKLRIEIAADGTVKSAEAVDGNSLLREAALASVRSWKFRGGPGVDLAGSKTLVFRYKLGHETGWRRCASRVTFDSSDRVEIFSFPPPNINDSVEKKK